MPPIYEDENTTREKLFELRKENRCQVCRGRLDVFMDYDRGKAFLACTDWPRTHHEGIEREAPPPFEPNIPTRREMMVEQLGEQKATQLEKYAGVVSLTKVQAMDILRTIWSEAPDVEVIKAAMLCAQYGLNPLMKHVALIKFKRRNRKREVIGEDWVTVMEISSNRLIARRRHNYSYLDLSPRRMTEEEQTKINGEVDATKIWALTHLKDVDTGAEAYGAGFWSLDEGVYGEEKGNTQLNMAKIRSERQALNRLYPAEMPHGVEVMEAKYIEGDYSVLPEGEEKIGEQEQGQEEERGGAAQTIVSAPKGKKGKMPRSVPAAEAAAEGESIDLTWLNDTLTAIKWNEDTVKTFLVSQYQVSSQGTLSEVIHRLTRDQAEEFVKELQDRADKVQPQLFP